METWQVTLSIIGGVVSLMVATGAIVTAIWRMHNSLTSKISDSAGEIHSRINRIDEKHSAKMDETLQVINDVNGRVIHLEANQ